MSNRPLIERRLEPNDSPLTVSLITLLAILAALLVGSLFFLPFGANPLEAYSAMFRESFGNLRGIGFSLVRATPLIFVGLGTIFAWLSGFFYLGFEGAILTGAAMAVWVALLTAPEAAIGPLPPLLFFPLVFAASFAAGGVWAGRGASKRLR